MSSPLSEAFRNAVIKRAEEIEEQSSNKVIIAMRRTEERVAEKIQEIITAYGFDYYYNGYTPTMYVRTDNLRNSGAVKPFINEYKKGGYIGFQYGAEFDAGLMDHSILTIRVEYDRKRDNKHVEKLYSYEKDNVDEEAILNNFRAGVHPNTSVNQGAIWMQGLEGMAPEALRQWKNSGAIQSIFKEELIKLLK